MEISSLGVTPRSEATLCVACVWTVTTVCLLPFSSVSVLELPSRRPICQLPKPKATGLTISPRGSYICTWSPYAGNPAIHSPLCVFVYVS